MDDDDERRMTDATIELPINGTLDLHTFAPSEVKDVVAEYVRECHRRGIVELRIVHGKGTGVLRRQVHGVLARLSEVASFALAAGDAGGWGATLVHLHRR
jgi:DNA-nicking Smr family endonuclease